LNLIKKGTAIFLIICCSQGSVYAEKNLRIVSLAPSITEILFALGLGEDIVGVSSHCNYPQEALAKEKIGSFSHPSIEKIINLRPDLILLTGLEQQLIAEKLKKLKLNFLLVYPSNIEGLLSSIRKIGKATGSEDKAGHLINEINRGLNELKEKVGQIPQDNRKTVFIELWYNPIITAGGGSFVNELIELAGGINIVSDTPRAYSMVSPELVISRNPDCIILGYMERVSFGKQRINARIGWENISAVKNDKIFNNIDPDLILRPGPRCIQGAREIYRRLYE
jgi:iron complex transport system substrate-binding protein